MSLSRLRPSPAFVIACVALFVAMGGVSYAVATGSVDSREIQNGGVLGKDVRDGTLTTKDIRNNEVRGADIRNSTIGGRDVAFNTIGGQDIKESTLAQVPDSGKLNGLDSTAFVRREAPGFAGILVAPARVVPGEVAPGYDVDGNGYVHLRGTFEGGAGTVFTLPAGVRPGGTARFAVRAGSDTDVLTIQSTGEVTTGAGAGADVSLDGVTFAAGG